MARRKVSKATLSPAADRKYQVENALDTLTRAEEHRRDPKMMRDVKKLAAEKQQALSRVASAPSRPKRK